jgi:hypothetical protein
MTLATGLPTRGFSRMVEKLIIQGTLKNDFSKENCVKRFQEYNEDVIRTCPREQLLVFDVREGNSNRHCIVPSYYILMTCSVGTVV